MTYAEQDGNDRETLRSAPGEDPGSLTTESETVNDTRRGEEEGVAGGERGREDGGVDDVRQSANTSESHGDDVGRLSGGSSVLEHYSRPKKKEEGRMSIITRR